MKKTNENGITLITLVVTILVLIILAGITLKITIGENGLIAKGKDARNQVGQMQTNTEEARGSLYNEIAGGKDAYPDPSAVDVDLSVQKTSDTSISATANATDTNSNIVSYTFYIRKVTEQDSSYVMIKKSDKLANTVDCSNLEKDMAYTVKVIALDERGTSRTAVKKIALGNAIQIKVKPISGPDSYPSTVAVTATSIVTDIDYIELPNGEQVKAKNGKLKLDTTYNSTKNGPITFKAYDKDGNAGKLEYDEENVINFETEWTIPEDNTTVTLPFYGSNQALDLYIDYGDGVKENSNLSSQTHTYKNAGKYVIKVSGRCEKLSSRDYSYNYINATKYMTKIIKWGCLENIECSLKRCQGLGGSIPEPHEKSFQSVKTFVDMFEDCKNITGSIPEKLFANCPNATYFSGTFSGCSGLTGSIPENLFVNCTNVTLFSSTFYYCRGLTGSIPEKLFANCPNVTSFGSTFSSCSGLTGSIPENLFVNCTNVTSFSSTFDYCNSLTGSIPEKLFANNSNVTLFFRTFSYCSGLTGSIPENLFVNCTNVTSFGYTFASCNSLTGSIPENLFVNCTNVTSFSSTFSRCSGLTGISENLFKNCTKVTDFGFTFYNCTVLTGTAPALWNRTNVTSSSGCFSSCTNLTNYADIPSSWK